MKCLRCQQENPERQKFCGQCGGPLVVTAGPAYADLQAEIERLRRLLADGAEQQSATAEILNVISSTPNDVQPALDAIARHAVNLCGGLTCGVYLLERGQLHLSAMFNVAPQAAEAIGRMAPLPISRESTSGRATLDRNVVNVRNVLEEPGLGSLVHEIARAVGHRAVASVPMLRHGEPIGAINVGRPEAIAFSAREIALLKTFADQAVIAIENVRLFTELEEKNRALATAHSQVSESLEQQTATSEILKVIAGSPTDLQPVLDALVENAGRLCQAADTALLLVNGDQLKLAASHGYAPGEGIGFSNSIHRGWVAGRAIVDARTVHVEDLANAAADFPLGQEIAVRFGHRTALATPLLREGTPIGTLFLRRKQVWPFSDKEVALLQTFADQAIIAIENVRLFTELQASNRELTTALDTQTATSDILRVISRSQTDVQPVFDAIVASAVRLLGAYSGTLTRISGEQIELAAITSTSDVGDAALRARFPQPLSSAGPHARTIRDRAPLNIANAHTDPRLPEAVHAYARVRGYRSQLAVPLLRHDEAIGTLSLTRREPGGFTTEEIELLKTFADQAVIAIENVRLFTELQASNRELTTALEQQTATGDILKVISSSPTDVQPVFDAIVGRATRLCEADLSGLYRFDGALIHFAAQYGRTLAELEAVRQAFPQSPGRFSVTSRAILDATVVQVADVRTDHEIVDALRSHFRTVLAVPMLRDGRPIGTITVARRIVRPFTDEEIALLQTFADQAVIAIENVRLFTELQTSNRDLTTALDTQTATSDILRVISRSQADAQPVFDTILMSAMRLLEAYGGFLTRIVGNQIELVAVKGPNKASEAAIRALYPLSLQSGGPTAQAIRDRTPINIVDYELDSRVTERARVTARLHGYRSWVVVPILHQGNPVGTILISRRNPGGFTDDEISLLQTFADQAVIAIENARLLTELQARTQELTRSVEQLTALGEVGRAVSSTLDLETVLTTIVSRAVQLSGLDGGVVFEYDSVAEEFAQRASIGQEASAEARRRARIPKGEGVVGRTAVTHEPVQVSDITREGAYESRLRESLVESGVRALLAVPMLREGHLIGSLVVARNTPGDFAAETIDLLRTFATQSALAIQNARLFQEIADKSRQLEVASQHKSEFLANMSHELRTPLNAVIGFSEVLSEGMFGQLNEKQEEYARDIYSSGQHLLSLINDILDLSKIEAGRMELELTDFHLPTALDNALILVRERASRRGIALGMTVDERLGQIEADERKIRQVVLNLLSNAIKFTPEGGRIEVRAAPVDGSVEVSVTDTGVGIAPEDQEAIFEEFKQVGTAAKKVEGTGLGLALSRKFIELHGGRIWVKSEPGVGSTFTFSIPVHTGA